MRLRVKTNNQKLKVVNYFPQGLRSSYGNASCFICIDILILSFGRDTRRVSAKGELNKLCSMRHWKPPVYECYEGGLSHQRV